MEVHDLRGWLVHSMQDLYSAENMLLEALPKMANAATYGDLKKAFNMHRDQTEKQVERLEEALSALDEKPDKSVKCKGMEGLIKEGEELLKNKGKIPGDVMDAALIEAAQKVEHYEIAGYGSAATYAEMLEEKDVAKKLKQNLGEEQRTDEKLTKLAEGRINKAAMSKH